MSGTASYYLTDVYGRTVTVYQGTYSIPGLSIQAPDDQTALSVLAGMAPPSYVPPNDGNPP